MREIKFRAWGGSDEKYFVYFNILNMSDDYVTDTNIDDEGGQLCLDKNEIDDIQRFTGINNIYEGDIVEIGREIRFVIFKDGAFQLKHYNKSCNDCEVPMCNYSDNKIKSIIVIGNIHQNPELLLTNPQVSNK